jgi:hypothetical protein
VKRARQPKCTHARCYERTDVAGTTCPWCTPIHPEGMTCEHCNVITLSDVEREARARMFDGGELDARTWLELHLLEALLDRSMPHSLFDALARADGVLRLLLVQWIKDAREARAVRECIPWESPP